MIKENYIFEIVRFQKMYTTQFRKFIWLRLSDKLNQHNMYIDYSCNIIYDHKHSKSYSSLRYIYY